MFERNSSAPEGASEPKVPSPVLTRLPRIGWLLLLCLLLASLVAFWPQGPRYRSYARVKLNPFTNAVLAGPFLRQTFGSLGGVRIEREGESSLLRISADGATPQAARRLADQATDAFSEGLAGSYHVTVVVIDQGDTPLRPRSLFRDSVYPNIKHALKRLGLGS